MQTARGTAPRPWSPHGFERFRALYPATPPFELPDPAPTLELARRWDALGRLDAGARRALFAPVAGFVAVVFVRGFLGNWMPGNLLAPCRAVREVGIAATLVRSSAGGPIARNARMVADAVARDLPRAARLVLCGHSRGGLECLWAVAEDPRIAERCAAVLLSQTPRGPSPVLESMLEGAHAETFASPRRRLGERIQSAGLHAIGAARGGRELTGAALSKVVCALDEAAIAVPVMQTASWSSVPTTWLDSFHERLGEIAPGRAHDGQFFLDDLVWPRMPHVLLPHLDHAQPAMGGHGFDHARYWLALISQALDLEVAA